MFYDLQLAAPVAATTIPVVEPFERLLDGVDLSASEAEAIFSKLVSGEMDDASMAALFVALRIKGETAEELTGAARALRSAGVPFDRPDYRFADSCGTGADGSGSINVSTAVALVVASCGLPIAKHGNRSITSRCGSADVLEALGAKIDIDPARSRAILDELGFCFLFAPAYHPGLRHAGPVRRLLKVRTVMNFLGPCLNPARPSVQLLGVADPAKLEPVARTLDALGVAEALVVHGGGIDEVALHADTQAVRMSRGRIEKVVIRPEDAGLERAALDAVRGGDPGENAARLRALLTGHAGPAERDLILLNAAALLMTARLVRTLREGVDMARDVLGSGAAERLMSRFVEASND